MKESKKFSSMAIGALVIVNAVLAAAVYVRTAEPPAYGQAAPRVDILAISSHYQNAVGPGAIAMLDSHSGQLILLRPNINGNAATALDSRNCSDDMGRVGH